MKIGIISNIHEEWGGSEELLRSLAKEALIQNHKIIISHYDVGKLHPKMIELISLGSKCISRRGATKSGLEKTSRIIRKISILIKNILDNPFRSFLKENPDIIVYNDSSYYFARDKYFRKLLLTYRNPVFISNQVIPDQYSPLNENERLISIDVFARSRKNYFVAERNIRTAERQLGSNIPNAEVVRNPVNIISPKLLSFPSLEVIRLASVANMFINHKAQDILLEGLAMSDFRDMNWQLEFYGDGIDKGYIERLIGFYGLADKAFIRGKTDKIEQVWGENHILVMPSLMEGTPLSMVEAMLCGRPVIISDVGGAREWVEEGKNGYLFSAASALSLTEALNRAYRNKENWKQMGENAFQAAIERYDPKPGATLLNKILSSL